MVDTQAFGAQFFGYFANHGTCTSHTDDQQIALRIRRVLIQRVCKSIDNAADLAQTFIGLRRTHGLVFGRPADFIMLQTGTQADAVGCAGQHAHGNIAFCFQVVALEIFRRSDFRQPFPDQFAAVDLQLVVIKTGYGLLAQRQLQVRKYDDRTLIFFR